MKYNCQIEISVRLCVNTLHHRQTKPNPALLVFSFIILRQSVVCGLPFLLTIKYPSSFPLSFTSEFTCLSTGKREHRTVKGKISLLSVWETSTGKRKILALPSFNSDFYARILRSFTFPRSMRQYANERQCLENYKHNTV